MTNLSTEQRISVARLRAREKMPYFSSMMLATVLVERQGLGTCAVDRYGRVYYDPEWIAKISPDEAAAVFLHEILHLGQLHFRRSDSYFGRQPEDHEAIIWNYAGDATINPILVESGCKLPGDFVTPAKLKLPENQSVERYYELLRDKTTVVKLAPQKGGSCADGVQREWECGPPAGSGKDDKDKKQGESDAPGSKHGPPGMSDLDLTMLARDAAEKIEAAKSRGNVPAGLQRWASEILTPKIDPKRELLALVKHGLSHASGNRDFTYRRPSRRRPPNHIVMPAMHAPVPRVTIVVDTSGSMIGEQLGLGLGLVASVLKSLPDQRGVRVLAGDTQVGAAKQVFRAEQVELAGGGGTDMAHILHQAVDERPRPQLIVLFTDGFTPWPETELPVPVVACLCCPQNNEWRPPAWIKTIELVQQ